MIHEINDILIKLKNECPLIYKSSLLTSIYSAIICSSLSWSSERSLNLVTQGSLLIDIGLLTIEESIRNKKHEDMNKFELLKYKQHPIFGMNMIANCKIIQEPIRQIIYQHHEQINGKGFPLGLAGIIIYPLAKIVALADAYSKILVENNINPTVGLRTIISNNELISRYDSDSVMALLNSFEK